MAGNNSNSKGNGGHKTFLERDNDPNKEDREFDEFVAAERKKQGNKGEGDNSSGEDNPDPNFGDDADEPEMLRTQENEENDDSGEGEENDEGGEDKKEAKNPYWDRLAKLQKAEPQNNEEVSALRKEIGELKELIKNQNSGGGNDNSAATESFSFREMEEGEDAADYQKEREKAFQDHVKKVAANKRTEKKPDEKPQNQGNNDDSEAQLRILEGHFKDNDDFLDVLDAKKLTVGMLPHINETADPEAVAKAIVADSKLARRIHRISDPRQIRMAILAVEHDVIHGGSSKPDEGNKEKEPPKDASKKSIPKTRPSPKKGGKKKGEDSLMEEFAGIASHGVNPNNRIIHF